MVPTSSRYLHLVDRAQIRIQIRTSAGVLAQTPHRIVLVRDWDSKITCCLMQPH